MINWFKIKKYVTFLIVSAIPLMAFFYGLMKFRDLISAVIVWLLVTIFMMFVGSLLIRHPMLQMVEGDGILAMTIDSTGLVQPFVVKVVPPFMRGKMGKKELEDVWDRDATFYIKHPKPGTLTIAEGDDGQKYEVIVLGRAGEDHNDKIFAFEGHLMFIFNKALNCFITKQALANLESKTLIKHAVFYLNEKVEELTMMLRDFARYIVEQTKPKRFFGLGNWFVILIIVAIVIIVLLMFPAFLDIFSSAGGIIHQPVKPTGPVIPRR